MILRSRQASFLPTSVVVVKLLRKSKRQVLEEHLQADKEGGEREGGIEIRGTYVTK